MLDTGPRTSTPGCGTPTAARVAPGGGRRARAGGREGGGGPLTGRPPAGPSRGGVWWFPNPGTAIPRIHHVTFHGCADAAGFRFRYFRRDGKNITWPVTHDGYRRRSRRTNEHRSRSASARRRPVDRTPVWWAAGATGRRTP